MTNQGKNTGKAALKKYVVLTAMFAIFALSMWMIFAPSKEKQEGSKGAGYNTELPAPNRTGIVADKKQAYEQEQQRLKQQEKLQSLQQYDFQLGENPQPADDDPDAADKEHEERQLKMAPKPVEYPQGVKGYQTTDAYRRQNSFEASKNAYQDINRTLGNFYEQPQDKEKDELKAKIEQLEAAITASQQQGGTFDDQVALMERSYQMAAKYMGGGQPAQPVTAAKPKATPVEQVQRHIVTALRQPMSNDEFVKGFSQPRNTGFNTAAEGTVNVLRNTIGAVVHNEQTVSDSQGIRLRLTEPLMAGQLLIPQNTVVTGFVKLQGERLDITVSSVEHSGRIVPVDMTVYDTDGQRGIFIPGSMEISAAKEIAANAGGNLGQSISLTQQSAGQQLATDLGRGVIQGTSAYLSKKIGQVKVTLKAGHRVMLLPSEN